MTTTLTTTLIGQMPNNLIEAAQLRKIVNKLIPTLFPVQLDILNRYIEDTKINELTNCMVSANAARRSGTSMIAAAIALAESRMGKSVLLLTDIKYETAITFEKMGSFSEWGYNSLKEDTLVISHSGYSQRGNRFDVVIYESFVKYSKNNYYNSVEEVHDRLAVDTNCSLIYTIHS